MTKGQVLYELLIEVFGSNYVATKSMFAQMDRVPTWEELPDNSRVLWNDLASRYATLKKRGKVSRNLRFGTGH